MKLKISSDEIAEIIAGSKAEFPKYTTQLINLANQNAQGTRPSVVGQLSDMIQEFTGKSMDEWQEWYIGKKGDAIETAVDRVWAMVQKLQAAITQIDKPMVEKWVRDLVLVKTFIGLRFQEAILSRIAQEAKATYRLASPEEEAVGIDGLVGDHAVSIKPMSYKTKDALPEEIEEQIVYYDKTKTGVTIEFEPWW